MPTPATQPGSAEAWLKTLPWLCPRLSAFSGERPELPRDLAAKQMNSPAPPQDAAHISAQGGPIFHGDYSSHTTTIKGYFKDNAEDAHICLDIKT